uniref:Uncharacterized protein n=1 Tax=Rhizophagus irregularis (strain DAOM 181602 / DAOM 197198 / MUCL 43194) TaxID=747089 RepID=U9U758_RHIID
MHRSLILTCWNLEEIKKLNGQLRQYNDCKEAGNSKKEVLQNKNHLKLMYHRSY